MLSGARRGAAVLALWLAVSGPATATPPNVILEARYGEPTTRYAHGVLGDAVEWGALELIVDQCAGCPTRMIRKFTIRLPDTRVFEDIAPRIVDLDGDESPEVIVVESDLSKGARLAVYYEGGLIAATPFIGRANRWLAPVGAADFDADGVKELAYIDRPHLAKTLRIWAFDRNKGLTHLADRPGLSNHRIGWDYIIGGIRDCGAGPEMITADAGWKNVVATRFNGEDVTSTVLGPFDGRKSVTQAMACE
ncbi:FG-GAP repeat domain-containing protein [Marimonas lutisalis]|uniref:FG-GAP repeat domain-containing protein n=1 Tax=Marimonas lutisalis TaxID=2545756 RepID=UPI001F3819D9|nr:VCBS repeat-containing protein [Marimonas lutisalis]